MSSTNVLINVLSERNVKTALRAVWDKVAADRSRETERVSWLGHELAEAAPAALFETLVIARLPRPQVTTGQDLAEAFHQQVLLGTPGSFDEKYQRFALVVVAGVFAERCSAPFACFNYTSSERFDLHELKNPLLWQWEDDFALSLNGILLATRPFDLNYEFQEELPHIVYATLVGRCTTRALDAAVAEIASILPSVFRSFHMLADMQLRADVRESGDRLVKFFEISSVQPLPSTDESSAPVLENSSVEKRDVPSALEDATVSVGGELATVNESTFDEPWGGLTFIPRLSALLDAYYSTPTKKDTMARRIRNAVHLLSQADNQSQHAVGLALSVSAIEALLCDGRDGIKRMFSDNIANLLEPDVTIRFSASDYVRKFYDARSGVLHGSETDATQEQRDSARAIAAAVLVASMERREYVRRLAGRTDEKPADFFFALERHSRTDGPFQGVGHSAVASLWRNPS
jgi:hypothetical protein